MQDENSGTTDWQDILRRKPKIPAPCRPVIRVAEPPVGFAGLLSFRVPQIQWLTVPVHLFRLSMLLKMLSKPVVADELVARREKPRKNSGKSFVELRNHRVLVRTALDMNLYST